MIYLLFGTHNHQPVGNFPEIFEKATKLAYKPFLEMIYNFPMIKWCLHCSGILFEYLEKNFPECIYLIDDMVKRGQLELISGGFYEPIISMVPETDAVNQIVKQNEYLRERFGIEPKGFWLPERIWEPHVPKIISKSNLEYTFVDDFHFITNGIPEEELDGYYITEEQHYILKVFPISKKMRYFVPFRMIEEIEEYFKSSSKRAHILVDDGEKFGIWPKTHEHVYLDGWLEKFFNFISENSSWIRTLTPSEFINIFQPRGRVYIPDTSYLEMTEWSLPPESQEELEDILNENQRVRKFVRGGIWRNFLVKYPEANDIHKKMLFVSAKVNKNMGPQEAFDALWAGQCNCAYWHGIFGGLYLLHLRDEVYSKLIEAEKYVDKIDGINFRQFDINCDGKKETIIETNSQNLYFIPHTGGTLYEWDIKPLNMNILNVLTRKKEAYHRKLMQVASPQTQDKVKTIHEIVRVKEKNLEEYLNYDWYRRTSLLDHFLHPDTTFDDFKRCKYGEQGDFILGNYDISISKDGITLSRTGRVWFGEESIPTQLKKQIIPSGTCGFEVMYRLKNLSEKTLLYRFAIEFNFSLPYRDEMCEGKHISRFWEFLNKNPKFRLMIDFSVETEFFTFKIYTVSSAEDGFEKTYQGLSILPIYNLKINPNEEETFKIKCKIEI